MPLTQADFVVIKIVPTKPLMHIAPYSYR